MKNEIPHEEKNRVIGGMLYLVSTPIGNLSDLSERAVKVLSEVDFIAAEDTRNTGKLLSCLGISKQLVSYHEHNKRERGEQLVQRMLAGESCALISDAGTPAISDPGEDLVALCDQYQVPVTAVPGCCAGITALTLSALPTARFTFEGFLPVQKKERRERMAVLVNETRTFILHEAPHKLRATLDDLCEALGADRRISLCRELTKKNEEILRTTLGEAVALYREKDPRGEYVLVIEGGDGQAAPSASSEVSPIELLTYHIERGLSKKDAIREVSRTTGLGRNELYDLLLQNEQKT